MAQVPLTRQAGEPPAEGDHLRSLAASNTCLRRVITEEAMSATVTAKGQVTIPKPVRDLLGIAPGSKVDFRRDASGAVQLVRADETQPASRFAKLRGHAGKGLSTDAIMALTRDDA
jgi:antitoxin PrlF